MYHDLKLSTKSLFKRNQTQSVVEEKTWRVRGLGTRDWKLASQEVGRGLSEYLHNQHALHNLLFEFIVDFF